MVDRFILPPLDSHQPSHLKGMFARPTSLLISLHCVACVSAIGLCAAFVRGESPNQTTADIEFFERKIRPLLSNHCYECHSASAKTVHGGLRLDNSESIRQGGDSGDLLIPGDPQSSLLIQSVLHVGEIEMPPEGKLPAHEVSKLVEWVRRGAPLPGTFAGNTTGMSVGVPARPDSDQARDHWAFRQARQQPIPSVTQPDWPQSRIDHFVLAAMQQQGLRPAPRADRPTLLRRLHFDLIGLPPTPEQVREFVADHAEDAFQRRVDELLQSPRYGERWARWWLDMARYTDRTASWLYQTGQAHLYRDWVVDAFNSDMPYDHFVQRQLATDLMSDTPPNDLPALGFIALSPSYWKELKLPCEVIKVIVADEWEERVDAVSRTFLGLTVSCARCHDHKFDPISSEDYYALAGIFASCRQVERPLIPESLYAPVRAAKQQIKQLESRIAKLKQQKPPDQKQIQSLSQEIKEIRSTTPHFNTPMANALSEESMYVVRAGKHARDGSRLEYRAGPRDLPLFVRGNPNRPGPVIARRFLEVLSDDTSPYTNGSGRLELARSITKDASSLAARVLVNRVWLAHFGTGIVATPSDLGRQGAEPTHPKLLDDLAARFIADGWSIKRLHREILLSATWQQSSVSQSEYADIDPENRFLWRMNRRRLDFEPWRDAMLSVGGVLDSRLGGPAENLDANGNSRRTLYGTIHRRDMSSTLMIHDFPDPTQHSPQRNQTTTALQGLYALNGPLLQEHAVSVTKRLLQEIPEQEGTRIQRAYWLLFGRRPSENELKLALGFLRAKQNVELTERWQQYVHVLLASNEFLFID